MKQNLVDTAQFVVKAGDGGKGAISFRREKYVPKGGPDGGDGGRGGSVTLRANRQLSTLRYFAGKDRFAAEAGKPGGRRQQFGEQGDDLILEVPAGTVVWVRTGGYRLLSGRSLYGDWYEDEFKPAMKVDSVPYMDLEERFGDLRGPTSMERSDLLSPWVEVVDLAEDGDEIVIARGGRGGKGNVHYKSSRQTTPRFAQTGEKGERFEIRLELKVLADVGLVGLPNAGKSTLLSVLTRARPEVAEYPFTTLSPNLGVLEFVSGEQTAVVADIPGLIEDAHEGKGLGDLFLRHVERCSLLVHVVGVNLEEAELDATIGDVAGTMLENYGVIRNELASYGAGLDEKKELLVINKMDVLPDEDVETIRRVFVRAGHTPLILSAVTQEGVEDLAAAIYEELYG